MALLPIVAVRPLFNPFTPIPSFLIMAVVTLHVDKASFALQHHKVELNPALHLNIFF